MIVGIIALRDCLGPKVLKGLITHTGKLNELKYESANWSELILLAAYGDWEKSLCFSSIEFF